MGQETSILLQHAKTGSAAEEPPIQRVPVLKRPGSEVDHWPRSSAEVKNEWNYSSTPSIYLHGADRDKFYIFICTLVYLIWEINILW
jgi:hypothetical protein